MKRRDFLKLLGLAPIVPSVLASLPKTEPLTEKVLLASIADDAKLSFGSDGYILYSSSPTASKSHFYNLWLEQQRYLVGDQWQTDIFWRPY